MVGTAPVITDGCTKIDAPMMIPTTSAVAWSAVIERESMGGKPGAAREGVPVAKRCHTRRTRTCPIARTISYQSRRLRPALRAGRDAVTCAPVAGCTAGRGWPKSDRRTRHVRCFFSGCRCDRVGRDRFFQALALRLGRWVARSIPLAAAVLTAGASMVLAQWGQGQQQANGQELFQWNGRVDREVQIVMRGGN